MNNTIQKIKILIVDDDRPFLFSLAKFLGQDFITHTAASFSEAQELLQRDYDAFLIDIRLDETNQNNYSGLELLRLIRQERLDLAVIMMTAFEEIGLVIECLRLGADDFIQKSTINFIELSNTINCSIEKHLLRRKVQALEQHISLLDPADIIGKSPAIQEIKSQILMAATDAQISVLITGETGTGKELAAKAIHRNSRRREQPFVAVSIASLNQQLLESELFGHEKFAFTGATKRHIGYFEKAKGGTLFLDEIGELNWDAQVKLLRFLENRRLLRLGSNDEIEIDLQLITATNKDLREQIDMGAFRADLFYRLRTLEIQMPRLVEHPEDIPQLVKYFIERLAAQGRTKIRAADPGVLKLLMQYSWPGNIRELRACIERSLIYANFHGHAKLLPIDLPAEVQGLRIPNRPESFPSVELGEGCNIKLELARTELAMIEKALRRTNRIKSRTWQILGYSNRHALYRRIQAIFRQFPALVNEYPITKESYATSIQN